MSAVVAEETLVLTRQFHAPIARVFAAWTQPELLAQWFGPENFTVINTTIDCCVGGQYEITIETPDKTQIKHWGEYVAVDAPNQLIFTWVLENQDCQGSAGQCATTLVELNFSEQNGVTELVLKHEKLPGQTASDGHRFGWLSSFECLAAHLAN